MHHINILSLYHPDSLTYRQTKFLNQRKNKKLSKPVADPGISKRGGGRGPGAVEFLGLGFVLMPLHTYPMCL